MAFYTGGQTDGFDYHDYVNVGVAPAVITGTQITAFEVASLMRNRGLTTEQIREAYYPTLTDQQAEACVLAVDAGYA